VTEVSAVEGGILNAGVNLSNTAKEGGVDKTRTTTSVANKKNHGKDGGTVLNGALLFISSLVHQFHKEGVSSRVPYIVGFLVDTCGEVDDADLD
jgi:hypothetical protein